MEFENYCYVQQKMNQNCCSETCSENEGDLSQFSSTNTSCNFSDVQQQQNQHASHLDSSSQPTQEQQQYAYQMMQLQQYQQNLMLQQQYYNQQCLQSNQNIPSSNQSHQQQFSQHCQQQSQYPFYSSQQFYYPAQFPQQQQQFQQQQYPQQQQQIPESVSLFQQPQQLLSASYPNHTLQNSSNPMFFSHESQPQAYNQFQMAPQQQQQSSQFLQVTNNLPSFQQNKDSSIYQVSLSSNISFQQFQTIFQNGNQYPQGQQIHCFKNSRIEAMRRRLPCVDTGKGGQIFRRFRPQRPASSVCF